MPITQQRASNEFLTNRERVAVVPDDNSETIDAISKQILRVLAEYCDWTLERALLELTFALDMIGPGKFRFLRQAIGEPVEALATTSLNADQRIKPRWDQDRGALRLGDQEIRKVRIRHNPSRVQRLMEAFEAAHWKASIKNPFTDLGQSDLHSFLNAVNDGLERIRFHSRAGAREITWSFVI